MHAWGIFLETPIEAIVPIVKEFYANGHDPDYIKFGASWVRGKRVHYRLEDINRLLGLGHVISCAYAVNINLSAFEFVSKVTSVIAIPELERIPSRDDLTKPLHLKERRLTETARALYKFVCSRLIPTGHQSDAT